METSPMVVVAWPDAPRTSTAIEFLTPDPLPSADLLLRACRGHRVIGGPILWFARDLAVLYERQLGRGGSAPDPESALIVEIRRRRMELVLAIDDWIVRTVTQQHRPGATLHTETVGAVIDRLAEASVYAHHALVTLDANDEVLHGAWHHLAELTDGYDDLVREVIAGRRRLPSW
ncbi:DUF4254 domain-containing protein [Nocardia sp. NPDC052254]|uniref:DUF4254 domain-containing protein n=1 Tax=Nocardia sp. NPDC052254 TaxID=3155681 RepID=UPI003429C69D